jgi:hypothetical protein
MASAIVLPEENIITQAQVVDALTTAKSEITALQAAVPGLSVDTETATAGAAELDAKAGVITTESLSTAAGAEYTLTLTNADVSADSVVVASVANGSNTTAGATVTTVAPDDGSVVIKVKNTHAETALNGTLKIAFAVVA